jgi:penicillin-binding protein 1C
MQVARLIGGEPTRNMAGKLRQMVHADALERALTKDEILILYLTLAPYGGNIEGIRAASLAYFGKEPGRLTTAECALLVALPQSPEARRPDRDVEVARAARNLVLDRMVGAGVVSRCPRLGASSRCMRLTLPRWR